MVLVKFNFMLNDEVKAWYKEEAEKMGMTMSNLMSYVLSQYKKNEEARQVLAELNQANKNFDMTQFTELMKLLNQADKDGADE